MKKVISLAILMIMTMSLVACAGNKQEVVETQAPVTQTVDYSDLVEDSNIGGAGDNTSSAPKISIYEEKITYEELEFERHEGVIFNINFVEDATQKDGDMTFLETKVQGSISGIPGIVTLYLPYSENWQRGEKAIVDYDIAYASANETYIRNITYVEKFTNEFVERKQREEEERLAEEARIAEEERLAEEARIAEEKEKAEQKKKQEEAYARRQAEIRRQEEEARKKAEEEERARKEAEDAKKSKIIYPTNRESQITQ